MRLFVILVTCLLISLQVIGQEYNVRDKITLNSGEVYVGKIVMKTTDMIMITTKDGTRYQFQLAEVAKIEAEILSKPIEPDKKADNFSITKSSFGGLAEFAIGISKAKYCFGWNPNTQLTLLFGNKNSFGGNGFLGAGIGYNTIYVADNDKSLSFLPLFFRAQTRLSKNRTAPCVGVDAGYAVALNSDFTGGVSVRIFAGITRRISYKTSLNIGAYAGVQSFSATLTEINQFGTYSYYGKTTLNNVGVKVGLMF